VDKYAVLMQICPKIQIIIENQNVIIVRFRSLIVNIYILNAEKGESFIHWCRYNWFGDSIALSSQLIIIDCAESLSYDK
jgi:hypothetical protein